MGGLGRYSLPLAVVVAAVLRVWGLGEQSWWYDEWDTVVMTQLSFGDMLARLGPIELTPPVYFVITWVWAQPFGDSEFSLRLVSALAGIATVPVLYLAARDLVSRRAGLIVAWLAAFSPVLVWYSQEARSYSLMLLLTALSFWFFVRAAKGESRALAGWAITSALSMATHYLSAALLVPEALWLLWMAPLVRRQVIFAIAPIAVTGVALLPLLLEQTGHGGWINELPLRPRLEGVPQNMALGFYSPWDALPWLALAVLAAAVVYALRRGTDRERQGLLLAGGIGLVGSAVLLAPVVVGSDYVLTRNLLGLWVPLGIGAGVALGVQRLCWLGPAATAALGAVSIGLVVWTLTEPELHKPDWRDLAEDVDPPTSTRVFAALGARGYNSRPLELYLPDAFRMLNRKSRPVVSELVLVRMRRIESRAVGTCFWGAMCNGNAGGLPFHPPPQFAVVQSGSTDRFDYYRYQAPRPVKLPKMNDRGRILEIPGS